MTVIREREGLLKEWWREERRREEMRKNEE